MPNGDRTGFGFPCRFPAAPSIRPESREQGIDHKRLFNCRANPEKIFTLSFPERQGKGTGGKGTGSSAAWRAGQGRVGRADLPEAAFWAPPPPADRSRVGTRRQRSYRSAAGVTTYRQAPITLVC